MYVDAKADLEEWLHSRLDRVQTRIAEEIERKERVKEGINKELDDAHEKVQQEFMSAVSHKETLAQEEEERQRRVARADAEQVRAERKREMESRYNLELVPL